MSESIPPTWLLALEDSKLTADLRVRQLRGLADGLRMQGTLLPLAKELSDTAQEHEAIAAEVFRLKKAEREREESARVSVSGLAPAPTPARRLWERPL